MTVTKSGINSTAATLLGLLHAESKSAEDLYQAAQDRLSGFLTATRSQVYKELADLAGRGYVTPGPGKPHQKGKRDYTISDAGHAAFVEWMLRPPGRINVRAPVLLRVAFAADLPAAELEDFYQKQLDKLREALRVLRLELYELRTANDTTIRAANTAMKVSVMAELVLSLETAAAGLDTTA